MKLSALNRQASYNLIINYAGLAIAFFNVFFKTRVLTAEEIGLITTITTITGMFQYISQMGIPSILIKYYPEIDDSEKSGFLFLNLAITLISTFFALLLFFIFKSSIIRIYHNPLVYKYIYFIVVYLVLYTFSNIFGAILRVMYKSVVMNFYKNFITPVLHAVLLVASYTYSFRFNVYFISYSIIVAVSLGLLIFEFSRTKYGKFGSLPKLGTYGRYLKYGFYMFSASLAGTMVTKIDKLMIGSFIDLKEVGIYTISVRIVSIMTVIGASFALTIHTKISDLLSKENFKELESIYKENSLQQLYIGLFLGMALINLSDDFLLVLGSQYKAGYYSIVFLVIGELVNLISGMCGGIISFSKYYKFDLYLRIILVGMAVVFNVIFIPVFRITGAAIATGATLIFYNLIKVIFVYIKFRMHPFSVKMIAFIVFNILLFYVDSIFISSLYGGLVIMLLSLIVYELVSYYILGYNNTFVRVLLGKDSGKDNK